MNFSTTLQFGKSKGLSRTLISAVLFAPLMLAVPDASAAPEDRAQAKRMHDRIAGVPPTAEVLDAMEALIEANDDLAAARLAMENDGFYDVTLKNMVAPWTNEAQSVFVPLNDYTATVIGLVRDDADFRTVLYDDVVYIGNPSLGLTGYSASDNRHYEELETSGHVLQDALVRRAQSSLPPNLSSEATAGIMTTRAAAQAFFSAGTNRAMLRFTLMNHLCNDLEQLNDTTRAPDRIRQDVSRSPGGDSRIFLNSCVGCHSGMDPLAQAFAYYDFEYDTVNDPDAVNGQLVYNTANDPQTGTRVQGKYLINSSTFEYGFVTTDDRWDNYWREGQNYNLGWSNPEDTTVGGYGAKSMGQELANSEAFASCQVKKVFKTVCLRDPVDSADRNQIRSMTTSFTSSGYRLKQVFAESASYCKGE